MEADIGHTNKHISDTFCHPPKADQLALGADRAIMKGQWGFRRAASSTTAALAFATV